MRKGLQTFVLLLCLLLPLPPAAAETIARNAVSLNGSAFVRTAVNSAQLNINHSVSFEFWFRANGPGMLLSEFAEGSATGNGIVHLRADGTLAATLPGLPVLTVATGLQLQRWHHVALSYDRGTGSFRTYLNGVAAATTAGARTAATDSRLLYFLGRGGPSNLGASVSFNGLIDEFRLWRSARSPFDIQAGYDLRFAPDPMLAALWHFDELIDPHHSVDSSGSNNPATFSSDSVVLVPSDAPLQARAYITTQPASLSQTSATFTCRYNPAASPMTIYFEWGPTTSYGQRTQETDVGAGVEDRSMSISQNLEDGTYHYRAVAVTPNGTIYGQDRPFIMRVAEVATGVATVLGRAVNLSGFVSTPNGPVSVGFDWGATTEYGNHTEDELVSGGRVSYGIVRRILVPAPGTYHFSMVATGSGRVARGQDVAFEVPPPSAVTLPPLYTPFGARFRGSADTRQFDVRAWFEWGATEAYGNTTAPREIAGSNAEVSVEEAMPDFAAGATYHYRLVVQCGETVTFGPNVTFTIRPPTFEMLAPIIVGPAANLRALVSAHGAATSARIEWGPTLSYGNISLPQVLSGTDVLYVQGIGGLQMGANYNYRLLLDAAGETIAGPNRTFTVPPPTAVTLAATSSGSSGRLRGAINPRGFTGTYWFQWGPTETYGNVTPSTSFSAGVQEFEVFRDITALQAGTTYHYRLVIASGGNTIFGDDSLLATPLPSVRTQLPTTLGRDTTLLGTVNSQGFPTRAWFEWGTTEAYGNTTSEWTPPQAGDMPLWATISPLEPGTIYHARIVARSGDLIVRGANISFIVPFPSAQTQAPTIAGSGATLRGSIETRGFPVSAWFEWGRTVEYGNRTPTREIGISQGQVAMDAAISNLDVGAPYNYRFVVQYGENVSRGQNVSFVSSAPIIQGVPPIVGGPNATLRASIDRRGFSGQTWFEWGLTMDYGNSTAPAEFAAGGVLPVEAQITGLLPGRTYNFRAVVRSGEAIIAGANAPFTVQPPSVQALAAQTSGHLARLRSIVNPRGFAVRAWHEWGETASYGSATPQLMLEGSSSITVEQSISDLTILGIYNYRGAVEYAGEVFYSANMPFIVAPPEIVTQADTQSGIVRLSGTIRTTLNGEAQIEWGPTLSYGNAVEWRDLTPIDGVATISHEEPAFEPGHYHFRVAYRVDGRTYYSPDTLFEIPSAAGYALPFTGTEFLRTAFPTSMLFDDEDLTIELWFNARAPGALLGEVDSVDASRWEYTLAEILADGTLRVAAPGVPAFNAGSIDFGDWHHLAIVYEDSTDLLSAYLDSRLVGTSPGDRRTAREAGRSAFVTVGRGGPANLGPGAFFNGLVDEFRIWRVPRSAADIARFYNRVLEFHDPPLLVGYWRFDHFGAQVLASPDSRTGGTQYAFYLPQRVPVPLEPSGAPLRADARPFIGQITTSYLTPELAQVIATVNSNGRTAAVRFLATNGSFQEPELSVPAAATISITNYLRIESAGAQFAVRAENNHGETYTTSISAPLRTWAGTAVRLTPDTTDFIAATAPLGAAQFPSAAFTVEAWFYPTSNGCVLSHDYGTLFENGRLVRVHPATLEIANGELIAALEGLAPVSLGPIAFNQWHHIAIRYNTETFRMDVFLDGANAGNVTGGRTRAAFYRFTIGAQSAQGLTQATGLPGFGGAIDEVRLWNIARASEDILLGRASLLTGSEEGLVLNWRFDDPDWRADNGALGFRAESGATPVRIDSGAPLSYGLRRTGLLTFDLQFVAAPGSSAFVEWTSDLVSWQRLQQIQIPPSGRARVPASFDPNAPRFYRMTPAF